MSTITFNPQDMAVTIREYLYHIETENQTLHQKLRTAEDFITDLLKFSGVIPDIVNSWDELTSRQAYDHMLVDIVNRYR